MANLSVDNVRVIALQALILVQQKTVLEHQRGFTLGGAISILIAHHDGSLNENFRAVKAECSRLQRHQEVGSALLLQAAREHFQLVSTGDRPAWPITPALAQLLRATTPPTQRLGRKGLRQEQSVLI